jgi:phosphohistidine phosphatase
VKTLLLLRHGKSAWGDDGLTDHDRPLKKRGIRDAGRMGRFVLAEGLAPDFIWSSTAVRARDTARLFAEGADLDEDAVELTEMLYAADPETILAVAASSPDVEIVAMVGHNPGTEEAVEALTRRLADMPTCALAVIELPIEGWGELSPVTRGRLAAVYLPRELPDDTGPKSA